MLTLTAAAVLWLQATPPLAESVQPQPPSSPPRIRETHPGHADIVNSTLTHIRITFDQEMSPSGHSICGGGPSFPEITGRPQWATPDTLVIPVTLRPGNRYELSINCPSARNFRGKDGTPAEICPLTFHTAAAGEEPPTLTTRQAVALRDTLRRTIDNYYSYRDTRGLDWDALFAEHAAALEGAETPAAFARAAAALLAAANDLHLQVRVNEINLPTGRREVSPNVDSRLLASLIPEFQRLDIGATGRFEDGIVYIAIHQWAGTQAQLGKLLQAVEQAAEANAPGMIVDVRQNSGGDEVLARQFAACFIEAPTAYAKSLIRDPSAPGGWAGPYERVVGPSASGPRYRGRIAILMGPACMSSNESFLLMMHKPGRREWFGANTWGSSGNPRPRELGNGITLLVPSWKDMTTEGELIEGKGLQPDHAIEWKPGERDPVLDAALAWLRR